MTTQVHNLFYIISETMPAQIHYKRPNIKDELKKMRTLLKRVSQCRLDKSEYDWLKSALLFRTGKFYKIVVGTFYLLTYTIQLSKIHVTISYIVKISCVV